jgi:hypothetical protein
MVTLWVQEIGIEIETMINFPDQFLSGSERQNYYRDSGEAISIATHPPSIPALYAKILYQFAGLENFFWPVQTIVLVGLVQGIGQHFVYWRG